MMFGQQLNSHRIFKRLAKALIRLHIWAGWSEPLLFAHITLLEISCRGSFDNLVLHTCAITNLSYILCILGIFFISSCIFSILDGVRVQNADWKCWYCLWKGKNATYTTDFVLYLDRYDWANSKNPDQTSQIWWWVRWSTIVSSLPSSCQYFQASR